MGRKIQSHQNEQQYFELLCKVGLVVHLSQMIEYNIANILAFDDVLRKFDEPGLMMMYEFNDIKLADFY